MKRHCPNTQLTTPDSQGRYEIRVLLYVLFRVAREAIVSVRVKKYKNYSQPVIKPIRMAIPAQPSSAFTHQYTYS